MSVNVAEIIEQVEPIKRLTKDLKEAAKTLSPAEARYVVDTYYQIQEYRKASGNQQRALEDSEEPHLLIDYVFSNFKIVENAIKRVMDAYTDTSVVGRWSKSIVGIGPVLSAGLVAHIDISKAQTAGAIWKFAGLEPTVKWEKKQKRPWNAKLKVLCWKISDSFVKQSGKDECVYGHLYQKRKAREVERNEAGLFKDQASAALEGKSFKRDTKAKKIYESGKLPPGHLDARARRYTVKIFLSHWHHVAYKSTFEEEPPKPWVIEHGGHAHYIPIPNNPFGV